MTNSLGIQKKDNYYIASKERAFLDTIYLNQSYYFDNLSSIDWEKCFEMIIITASRDVYDIWFFLKNLWPVNKEIVERRTGTDFRDHLRRCLSFIESFSDSHLLAGLGDLLDEKQKAWARARLKQDTIYLLKPRLQPRVFGKNTKDVRDCPKKR